jgi:hypothetical protein
MISLATVLGVLVVAAAVAAVCASDGRLVAVAVFVALAASPFLASPLPGSLQIAARFVAALLAAYVLWIVMKGGAVKSEGSAIGIVAEVAVAAAAYVAGWWVRPVDPLQGPVAEQAVGFALIALAALPLAGSSVLRAGVGVMLVVLGAGFVMDTWLGQPPVLVQLGLTTLLLVIPAVVALLVDVDDPVARVIPAIEQVRPEATAVVPRESRVPALEAAAQAEPVEYGPAVSGVAGVPGAASSRLAREAERAAGRGSEASSDAASERRPETTRPSASRPSIRFFGRAAQVRRGDDSRTGSPGGFRYARRLGGSQDAGEAPDDGSAGSGEAPAGGAGGTADAGGADAGRAGADSGQRGPGRIRNGADPRNPRFKRPLR